MNAVLNSDPIETQFLNFMIENGMKPKNHAVIADGKLHRFEIEGDRDGSKNGAYKLYSDGWPSGYLQNWKTDEKLKWKAGAPSKSFAFVSHEEREAKIKAREEEQKSLHERAARVAKYVYRVADNATSHPYMKAKGLDNQNVKVSRGNLVIPYQNIKGEIRNLQFIDADGNKNFLKGSERIGLYHQIGKFSEKTVVIAEGWSTGMSIHQERKIPVIVAGNAGNLLPVAEAIRAKYKDANITIAADNDEIGLKKATEAAQSVGGRVAIPKHGKDWNDFFTAEKSKSLSR